MSADKKAVLDALAQQIHYCKGKGDWRGVELAAAAWHRTHRGGGVALAGLSQRLPH